MVALPLNSPKIDIYTCDPVIVRINSGIRFRSGLGLNANLIHATRGACFTLISNSPQP